MELDWCSDVNLFSFENFNENSVINKNKKKSVFIDINNNTVLNSNDCFNINLNQHDNNNILLIINYLSFVSNHIRTLIRNKSTKYGDIKKLTIEEYDLIIKYLNWLILASNSIKKFFAVPVRRDNSYDPLNVKLFKTSSYKFCNFKESCSIHKNKQSKCDKNHFVFEMIINDIQKLKESLEIIGFDNVNWTLSNKLILSTFDSDTKQYFIENIDSIQNNFETNEFKFVIDKTLIFKSFDVISYVLNKMYEESMYFLNNNLNTLLINID